MELRIENMGPLKDVTLPIRSMNVIIGPNHQGKTWLAYTLYGVALAFIDLARRSSIEHLVREYSEDALVGQPKALDAAFKAVLDGLTAEVQSSLEKQFQDSSGVIARAKISLHASVKDVLGTVWTLRILKDGRVLPQSDSGKGARRRWEAADLSSALDVFLRRRLGAPFALPAERNALVLVYKLLTLKRTRLLRDMRRYRPVTTPKDQTENEQLFRELGEPGFPEPVEAFLDFMNEVEIPANPEQRRDAKRMPWGQRRYMSELNLRLLEVADLLEGSLLHGQVLHWEPTGFGGRELMLKVDGETLLDLHNASSAAKQISPLLLWLRSGRVSSMSLLIIDEPELNLHPVAQAKLLEGLAILVSLGIRVVLTTHSPYLISHLNNLIAAHPTDEALRARQAQHLYLKDPRAFMTPESVGAWHLDQGVLRDLYEPEWGIRSDSLGDASEEIHRLYYAIRAEESPDEAG